MNLAKNKNPGLQLYKDMIQTRGTDKPRRQLFQKFAKGSSGVLSTKQRKAMPKSSFAIPSKAPGSGSYPINDPSHARNALARVSQHGNPSEKARVRAAVHRKFPSIGNR